MVVDAASGSEEEVARNDCTWRMSRSSSPASRVVCLIRKCDRAEPEKEFRGGNGDPVT